MQLEINKELVLSMSHLPLDIARGMAADAVVFLEGEEFSFSYDTVSFGYLVYALNGSGERDEYEQYPRSMRPAIELARAHDCKWVRYDADGPTVGSLPLWEY